MSPVRMPGKSFSTTGILRESILQEEPAFFKTSGKQSEKIFISTKRIPALSARPAEKTLLWCTRVQIPKKFLPLLPVEPLSIRGRNVQQLRGLIFHQTF